MAKGPDFNTIKQQIKTLVSEITEIPESDFQEDTQFVSDLGIDSMLALEIVASIEKKYRVAIPEEKIPTIRSLGDVYRLLEELTK